MRVGGGIDPVHPRAPGGSAQDEGGAAGQQRHLVGRQPLADVGTGRAGPEVHGPGVAERERHHDRAEGGVIGVHADPLAGTVLVDDALLGHGPVEVRRESGPDDSGPARERGRRIVPPVGGAPVVVLEAVVLNAAAEVGHPERLRDAQQDAFRLGLGNDIGHQRGALVEYACGVAGHGLSLLGQADARTCARLRLRRRFENDDRARHVRETGGDEGAHRAPVETAQAAPDRRDGDGADAVAGEGCGEAAKPGLDVADRAAVAPVTLGGEVDDPPGPVAAGVEHEHAARPQPDPDAGELTARFEGRDLPYGFGELDALVPAYAATVHKSQGSEYPAVVIPVLTQHYAMLKRNLLYTGVTRGKRLVVLVGQKKAVAIAVRNASGRRRWSKLDEWLAGAKDGPQVGIAPDARSIREAPLTRAMPCG